jgi:RimJ/RimL family protein N-acetyltransferase
MAAGPVIKLTAAQALRLTAFDERYAERVVSWVRDSREAYWLAPRTTPPLTGDKVRAWAQPGRNPFMLAGPEELEPLAYGELNELRRKQNEYWLGHLIVDPQQRGHGLGRRLTELLLDQAFHNYGARRVSLVVFPDNLAAIATYRSAGMRADGYETHCFGQHWRPERLLRFVATRSWRQKRRHGSGLTRAGVIVHGGGKTR